MNVSMQDTYNHGWKLGSVIAGSAKPSILKTYQVERHEVALNLIATDHAASRFYSQNFTNGSSSTINGMQQETLEKFREKHQMFLSGVAVDYSKSIMTASTDECTEDCHHTKHRLVLAKQHLAPKIGLGIRLPSYKVINQVEARPAHLAEMLKSD